MRRIPPLLALLAATLLLMSVAFADGRPTVFYDSHSYDMMGRNLIEDGSRTGRPPTTTKPTPI